MTVKRAAQFARILGYSVNQFVAVVVEDQLRKAGLKVRFVWSQLSAAPPASSADWRAAVVLALRRLQGKLA